MKTTITSILCLAALIASAQIPQNGLVAHFNCNGAIGLNSNVNGNIIQPNNYSSNTTSGGKTKPLPGPDRFNFTDSALTCEYTGYHYSMNYKSGGVNNTALRIKKQITFGCWILVNGGNQFNMSPLVFGAFGPQYASYAFQGNLNNGNIYAMVSSNTANNQSLGRNISNEGTGGVTYYRHLMATIGADDTFRFYFQGKQVGAAKFQGDSIKYFNHSTSNPYFSIGADFTNNGWNGTGFNGSVDDVLIYDRALTPQEIWTLFNNSSKCTISNAAKPGHLWREQSGSTHLLTVADSLLWHRDDCEFEWYANGNYGLTTKMASGKSIAITKNGTYKAKVIHQATRCWYWTNDIVVTNLSGGSSSVNPVSTDLYSMYPNPAKNNLTITAAAKISGITIVAADGKVAQSLLNSTKTSETLDIASLKSGLYFVRLTIGDKTVTQRLIKE